MYTMYFINALQSSSIYRAVYLSFISTFLKQSPWITEKMNCCSVVLEEAESDEDEEEEDIFLRIIKLPTQWSTKNSQSIGTLPSYFI